MRNYAVIAMMATAFCGARVLADGCKPACAAPCPQPTACCPPVKKECVRVEDKKKKVTVEYSCIEEDICKTRCALCGLSSLSGLLRKGCKSCDSCEKGCSAPNCSSCEDGCNDCGRVRTRRKLVKKFVTEEVCGTKCVPMVKEDCCPVACPQEHCGPAPCAPEVVPMKPVEKLPMPDAPMGKPMQKVN